MVYRRRALSPLFAGLAMCAPAAGAGPAAVPAPAAAPLPAEPPAATPHVIAAPQPDPSPSDTGGPDPTVVHTGPPLSAEEVRLWQSRIRPRLGRDLWQTPARYDAAALLMLPLHAAFERNYPEGQQQIADHIARFMTQRDTVRLNPDAQLSCCLLYTSDAADEL